VTSTYLTISSTISPLALLLLVMSGRLQSHSHVLIHQKIISKNSVSSLKWVSSLLRSTGAVQREGWIVAQESAFLVDWG